MESSAAKSPAIPVTIVAGFLGAGKTTLLNHILTAEHGRRIGVLVNDFGSINVDAELITEVENGVVSLANGCICCSIRMDLIRSVLELAERPDRPEHIVIESSGVADPAGIVTSFLDSNIWGTVRLDGVITVVDAEQTLGLPEEEMKLARVQVAGGDLIALNKIDLVEAKSLNKVLEWIHGIRPGVQVFETIQCQLPMEILLGTGAMGSTPSEPATELGVHTHEVSESNESHHHEHGLAFDTWTFTSGIPLKLGMIQQLLSHLPSTLFRAKGFLHTTEEPQRRVVLQLVGRRATVTPTRSWGDETPKTRIVFISRHDSVDFEALKKALSSCQEAAVAT